MLLVNARLLIGLDLIHFPGASQDLFNELPGALEAWLKAE